MPSLLRGLRRHITYANTMSTIAAVASLSAGSAYAASKISGSQIRPNTVTSRQVKNGSLGIADLSRAARFRLRGPAGHDGAAGAAGARGSDGAAGAKGADGANGTNGTDGTSGLTQLSSVPCTRGGTAGVTRTKTLSTGYMNVFCEIPLAADAGEPNDVVADATQVSVPQGTYLPRSATFHTAGDIDYYRFTFSCSYSAKVVLDGDTKLVSATVNGVATPTLESPIITGCSGGGAPVTKSIEVGVTSAQGWIDDYTLAAESDGA